MKKAKKKVVKKKKAVKKPAKKTVKKAVKKSEEKQEKPIGAVTHFYGHIKVAVVKFKKPFKAGTQAHFCGATTDFKQKVTSIQYEHQQIKVAKKGQSVGIKVAKMVRGGDMVYPVK